MLCAGKGAQGTAKALVLPAPAAFLSPLGSTCATTDPPQGPSFMTFLCQPSEILTGLTQATGWAFHV